MPIPIYTVDYKTQSQFGCDSWSISHKWITIDHDKPHDHKASQMDPMLLHKRHCYQWILSALPLVLRSGLPVGPVFLDEYGTWMGFGRFINPNRVDSGLIYPDLIRWLPLSCLRFLSFWHTPSSENWRKLWLSASWSGQKMEISWPQMKLQNDRQNWSFPALERSI